MRKRMDDTLIIKTALTYFAQYGYKKTTLDDIATALDMSNTNIYSYAKSKRDLYDSCIAYAINAWQDDVRSAVEGLDSPKEILRVGFEAAVRHIDTHPETQELLRKDPDIFPMFPSIDPIEEYNAWSIGFITDVIRAGIDKGEFRKVDVTETADALFAMYKYIIISLYEDDETDRTLVTNRMQTMLDLVLNGLLND